MSRRSRIGWKLVLAAMTILVLMVFARETVDFVYTGF